MSELDEARQRLFKDMWRDHHAGAAATIIQHDRQGSIDMLVEYFRQEEISWMTNSRLAVLEIAVNELRCDAVPILMTAVMQGSKKTSQAALGYLAALRPPVDDHLRCVIENGLREPAKTAQQYIRIAAVCGAGSFAEPLWELLQNSSKPVRQAASEVLGPAATEEILTRALPMLQSKKAAERETAARLLGSSGNCMALARLKQLLETEQSAAVRDEVHNWLQQAIVRQARDDPASLDPAEIRESISSQVEAAKAPGPEWLRVESLPPLSYRDGRPLSEQETAWLLFRQSRHKEAAPDPEAAPLYAVIDRTSSGDFAFALATAAIKHADNKLVWMYIAAAMLGDDRIVPELSAHVQRAAGNFSMKQGQWAIEALGLLGTDAALLSIDAAARKYKDSPRRKFNNIGKHADEAIQAVARRRNVSLAELADRIVPWFGFPPGENRVLPAGKHEIEVRIGPDFKFAYQNKTTGKWVASIPKAAGEKAQAEFKGAGKLLREVVKNQTYRLESDFVAGRRWHAARWSEVFLPHPLLFRYAASFVWGCFDEQGALAQTFRPLEDRSLSDAADNGVKLPESGEIGLVHPLQLDEELRQQWRQHLADYEVSPPFPQLDRLVTLVGEEEKPLTFVRKYAGHKMLGITLRGRAEKREYNRGAAGDGGYIGMFWKRFPQADIDVILSFDGIPVYADLEAETTLGPLMFCRLGSVDTTHYGHDDPTNESDPRLIKLGEVPPVLFSEAMYDLRRIVEGG